MNVLLGRQEVITITFLVSTAVILTPVHFRMFNYMLVYG